MLISEGIFMKITGNQFDNLYVRAQNRQCPAFGSAIEVSKEIEKLAAEDNSCEKWLKF